MRELGGKQNVFFFFLIMGKVAFCSQTPLTKLFPLVQKNWGCLDKLWVCQCGAHSSFPVTGKK